jgi:putative redox protein
VKATARRREGFVHEVEIEGGHSLVVDEPVADGGTDAGPSPTRLLAASLASCTAITIEMYAGRKGWDLGEVEVEVDQELGSPSRFDVVIRVAGEIDDEQHRRLLIVAAKCPVHRALAGEVEFSDRLERV